MLGLGFTECLLIVAVATFVIQPKSLPWMMRSFGQGISKLKRAQNQFKLAIEDLSHVVDQQHNDPHNREEDVKCGKKCDLQQVENFVEENNTYYPIESDRKNLSVRETVVDSASEKIADTDFLKL